jgi:hypothetical protein
MTFEIPTTVEPEIIKYARTEHITADEAIVRLIHAGLSASRKEIQLSTAATVAKRDISPSVFTSSAAEEALGHIWNDPQEDEAWQNL